MCSFITMRTGYFQISTAAWKDNDFFGGFGSVGLHSVQFLLLVAAAAFTQCHFFKKIIYSRKEILPKRKTYIVYY